jgi:membrane fusion protein, multidrug efflux system
VVFSVPEDRVEPTRALLARDGALKVRPWGVDGAPLAATVREVGAAADPATRTFLVKADVGRASLRLGQTATVVVELPPRPGITKLPLAAVMEHQGRSAVWLLDTTSMTVQVRPITVAGADGNEVVVAGGLEPGQVVVTAGVHTLTPGQKVRLYAGPAPVTSASAAHR